MNLTRANFDDEALSVMDQAARLLYAHHVMRQAGRMFNNNPDLDAKQEGPTAMKVIKFTRKIGVGLFGSRFWRPAQRAEKLAAVYAAASAGIKEVLECAEQLAKKEESIGPGTSIRVGVVQNLMLLRDEWAEVISK